MNFKHMAFGAVALTVLATGCNKAVQNSSQSSTQPAQSTSQNTSDNMPATPQGVEVGGALMVPNLNIVANAQNASNVTTLVAAVKAAGLVDTLSGPGPFTVFAPTNDAFNKLPAGTVNTLLEPANKAMLANILEYHVVPGRYLAKDLTDGMVLKTVEGQTITIHKDSNGNINVNGTSNVQTADVVSSNGVTFVVDTVLMPPAASMMH